jgi:hypothetical protein
MRQHLGHLYTFTLAVRQPNASLHPRPISSKSSSHNVHTILQCFTRPSTHSSPHTSAAQTSTISRNFFTQLFGKYTFHTEAARRLRLAAADTHILESVHGVGVADFGDTLRPTAQGVRTLVQQRAVIKNLSFTSVLTEEIAPFR